MKGSVCYHKTAKRWYVSWSYKGKVYKIYRYLGMYLETRKQAEKVRSLMQGDVDRGCFRIEKYTQNSTDTMPYLRAWLEAIKTTISPATYKDYKNSIENHIAPFFEATPVMLHEIQYDTLMQLLGVVKRTGKGKLNVLYCLHACLDYAWRSNRIPSVPAFPKKGAYQIMEPVIQWLPSDRQEGIIRAIPEEHQPIFWWLKYHLRRPSEGCALRKEDYAEGVFTVRRGFSAKVAVDRTKTGETHIVPAHGAFLPYLEMEQDKQKQHGIISPYLFVNPAGKMQGRHYTLVALEKIWDRACTATGESISLYSGLKHSTASQMKNEWGYTDSEIQEAGDWARKESVKKYAKTEVSARRNLLEGKVRHLGKIGTKDDKESGNKIN